MIEQHDLVGVLRDEIQIVRDQNDRHVLLGAKLGDKLIEKLQAILIDARDRLIEEQKIRRGIERERKKHALQFTARQRTEPSINEMLGTHARKAF